MYREKEEKENRDNCRLCCVLRWSFNTHIPHTHIPQDINCLKLHVFFSFLIDFKWKNSVTFQTIFRAIHLYIYAFLLSPNKSRYFISIWYINIICLNDIRLITIDFLFHSFINFIHFFFVVVLKRCAIIVSKLHKIPSLWFHTLCVDRCTRNVIENIYFLIIQKKKNRKEIDNNKW